MSLPQRPSATELLKHRFIKGAKKNAILVEPLEKYQKWRLKGNGDEESDDEKYVSHGGSAWTRVGDELNRRVRTRPPRRGARLAGPAGAPRMTWSGTLPRCGQ